VGIVRLARAVVRLPAGDRRRAAAAALQLTRATLELRLAPTGNTIGLLGAVGGEDADQPAAEAEVREAQLIGATVERVAARLPWHPTCLRQALAVQRMLRRRGIASRLHLGVTGTTEAEAHAWVTVGGHPIVGGLGHERFVPLAAFR
jgi:hypothetical protein